MSSARRTLRFYWAVVALYVLVFGWWMVYFSRHADILLRRVADSGIVLSPEQGQALHAATRQTMRMFLFEGGFVGLMLLASVYFVVRSMQREVRLSRQQSNFLSAVTHELRSPIASARLYIESLQLGRAEGEKRERYLEHSLQDLDRLRDMVDHLLETARMTNTEPLLDLVDVELGSFTARALERLASEAGTRGAVVELSTDETVPVRGDERALETILRNMLSNSVKYGGEGVHVEVSVNRLGPRARLELRDHGPGLQGADPRRIFAAFERGGDELVRTRQGVGLGLYMVAELARGMGGSARAQLPEDGGLAIVVELPLALGASGERGAPGPEASRARARPGVAS